MVDSLAMFFGAKKRKTRRSPRRTRKSPKRTVKKSNGVIVVKGRERKLHKGSNGGLYYKTKAGRNYVDAKFIRAHSPRKMRRSKSPRRTRRSPRRTRRSPRRTRRSPRRTRRSPMRRTRFGFSLGMPNNLTQMMGPVGM